MPNLLKKNQFIKKKFESVHLIQLILIFFKPITNKYSTFVVISKIY